MEKDSKIFVDADEEVNFVAEKIAAAPTNRVAVVIPDGASVLRSNVSLRLLKRKAEQEGKSLVVVSMDAATEGACKNADIKSVGRVGDITENVWTDTDSLTKSKLLPTKENSEVPSVIERNRKGAFEKNVEQDFEEQDPRPMQEEPKEEETENLGDFEFVVGKEIKQEEETGNDTKEGAPAEESKFVSGVRSVFGRFGKKGTEDGTEEKSLIPNGEDLDKPKEEEFVVPVGRRSSSVDLMRYAPRKSRRTVKVSFGKPEAPKKEKAYTATDITPKGRSYDGGRRASFGGGATTGGLAGIFKKMTSFKPNLPGGKLGIIIGGVVLIGLFGLFVYLYWIAPRVRVVLYVKIQPLSGTYEVTGDTTVTSVSTTEMKIPLFQHATTNEGSESIMTTGEDEVGEKAAGEVSIFNLQPKAVTIANGTILTCTTAGCSGLTFVTTGAVTIPKGSSDKVGVQATDIGEDYNIGISNNFKVGGYNQNTEVFGTNVTKFSGGTAETVQVVAKSDQAELESDLQKSLTESCKSKLRTDLDEGTLVIEKSVKTEVTDSSFDANVGAQTDVLNMNMSVECSALIYRKSDLTQIGSELVSGMVSEGYMLETSDLTITDAVLSTTASSAKFELSVEGSANPELQRSELRSQIKGQSYKKANEVLDGLSNVEDHKIIYHPSWAPGFLKRIPTNDKDVIIEFSEVETEGEN